MGTAKPHCVPDLPSFTLIPHLSQDTRLALQWVRSNIAAFGGSPEKVAGMASLVSAMHVRRAEPLGLKDPQTRSDGPLGGSGVKELIG